MKKAFLLLIAVLSVSQSIAQNNELINFGVNNWGTQLTNSYIDSSGNTIVSAVVGQDVHIGSYDSNNNVNWSRIIYSSQTNNTGKIYPSSDGSFFVNTHHHVFKVDANGNEMWSYELLNPVNGIAAAAALPNGGFAIAGLLTSDLMGTIVVIRSDGTIDWMKKIESSSTYSIPRKILITPQDEIMTLCNTGGLSSYLFTTWDQSGNVISDKQFKSDISTYSSGYCPSAKFTSNGHLYLTGFLGGQPGVAGLRDMFIYHFDENINYINGKLFKSDFDDEGRDLVEDSEGMLIAIGMSKPILNCTGLLKVMRLTPNLDTLYTRHYGELSTGFIFTGVNRKDSTIYATGTGGFIPNFGLGDGYLIKTDRNFNLSCGHYPYQTEIEPIISLTNSNHVIQYPSVNRSFVSYSYNAVSSLSTYVSCSGEGPPLGNDELAKTDFSLFPNPVVSQLEVRHSELYENLKIYSIQGDLILNQSLDNQNTTLVDCQELESGTYIVQLSGNNNITTKRLIKY